MTKQELGNLIIASENHMYGIAKSLLQNDDDDDDCADAIQEAIVNLFSNLHTLKNDNYAKTWLIRILINECYGVMRKEKKLVSLETVRESAIRLLFQAPQGTRTVRTPWMKS